jgi:hypothetical protein
MTRRRAALPKREPNGRHSRSPLDRIVDAHSPTEIKRLRDAALSGLRAPEWGSELGRLLLHGKLTPTQYEAGRRFAVLVREYHSTLGAPDYPKASLNQNARSGHAEGPTEAVRHQQVILAYDEVINALGGYGGRSFLVVKLVCDGDASVSTADALRKLTYGLDTLAAHWGIPA